MKHYSIVVDGIRDMQNGTVKNFTVAGIDLALVKSNNGYHALGGTCPHKGAPLEDGLIHRDRILCPWHHARFDAETGDRLDSPARDSLRRFPVTVTGNTIHIDLPDDVTPHRCCEMAEYSTDMDHRTFVILGSGAAGAAAVETLRGSGFRGRLIMLTREQSLPYDRTDLSKGVLAGKSNVFYLRDRVFYEQHDVELHHHKTAKHLNPSTRILSFTDGCELQYHKLLLATGADPVIPGIPGTDLTNVFTLRSPDDVEKIRVHAVQGHHVVLVGAGFISLECASQFRDLGLAVTVIAPTSQPFEHILGFSVGEVFRKIHEKAGVRFITGTRVDAIEMEDNLLAVYMENDDAVTCDFVILGTGVRPATQYLPPEMVDSDGGVTVDDRMCVPGYHETLYAAGDLARFPRKIETRKGIRVEHWRVAEQMGRTAALNMAGRETRFTQIPFFWTRQQGTGLKYVGHADQWDDIRIIGNLEEQKFAAFYMKRSRILAVAAVGMGDLPGYIEECMIQDTMPDIHAIEAGTVSWTQQMG